MQPSHYILYPTHINIDKCDVCHIREDQIPRILYNVVSKAILKFTSLGRIEHAYNGT